MRKKYTLITFIVFLLASCVDTKQAVYFNNISSKAIPSAIKAPVPIIEPNDLLSISVSSLNNEASTLFNNPNTTNVEFVTETGGVSRMSGYLVSPEGDIQFPLLGKIKAAGLSKKDLADTIGSRLIAKQLLFEPIVNIRFLNFKVTVLGEVNRPSAINVVNEKITLLEAIGLAGDITILGKRDNVMVIREEDNQKVIQRINLNSAELFTSPYYYLKSNDIVYVEPNREKVISNSGSSRNINTIIASLSLAVSVLYFITR